MQVAILILVRKQSQRCPEKVTRDFHQGRSLTEIALEKFRGRKDVFLSALEPEFEELAARYEVGFLPRPEESTMGETQDVIKRYLYQYEFENIMTYNVCCPFTQAQTVDRAIATYLEKDLKALMCIYPFHELVIGPDRLPVNRDANVLNSKFREPLFQISNNFIIHNMKRYRQLDCRIFESYQLDDPYFFEVTEMEALDIDTELQYEIAQNVYRDHHAG